MPVVATANPKPPLLLSRSCHFRPGVSALWPGREIRVRPNENSSGPAEHAGDKVSSRPPPENARSQLSSWQRPAGVTPESSTNRLPPAWTVPAATTVAIMAAMMVGFMDGAVPCEIPAKSNGRILTVESLGGRHQVNATL